jgi:hypothetical protein
MRLVLAAIFVVLVIGSFACGIVLGGPPGTIYRFADVLIVLAEGLLFLGGLTLIALVAGFGSEGQKRSTWKLPILCLIAGGLSFLIGVAILASDMEAPTPQHAAINLRLKIFAGTLILFALFSGLCLIISYFLAKHHNSKLS